MSTGAVAETVDDLTPAWLSTALSREVTSVSAERIGTGQMGTAYRLSLDYAGDGSGPAHLVAKLAAVDPAMRGLVAEGYRKEVGFYTHLAPATGARVPTCWYSAISGDSTTFTLLLEDLHPATPGVQADGCSATAAAAALRNVAGLHASSWNDRRAIELGLADLVQRDGAEFVGQIYAGAVGAFVDRFRDQLPAADVEVLVQTADVVAAWLVSRPQPFALTHGDYRLDNLMFHPDHDEVIAVDWQTLSVGPPGRDVGYFLGTSLDTDLRRAEERRLVETYHAALVANGVQGYDAERCYDDYRLGVLQGPLITVVGCEYATGERTPGSDAMFLAMATRACAAIRDLGTLELVD